MQLSSRRGFGEEPEMFHRGIGSSSIMLQHIGWNHLEKILTQTNNHVTLSKCHLMTKVLLPTVDKEILPIFQTMLQFTLDFFSLSLSNTKSIYVEM